MALQKLLLLSSFLILSHIYYVSALKVLVIVSLPLKSHYMAFQTLFRELSLRGHSVTVINNYPEVNPPPNITFIDISSPFIRNAHLLSDYENVDSFFLHLKNFLVHFAVSNDNLKNDCENLLMNHNMRELLQKREKFDIIFVEQFMSDCGLMFAGTMYDAPIIGITSHTLLPWAYPRLGIPFDVVSDAFYFSNFGINPSSFKIIENYLMNIYMNTFGRWKTQKIITDVFKKHVPNATIDVEKIAKQKIKMMFVNQHFSVTGARLLPPQILEIGGIHIEKPKPVSEDIEKFLSSAKHGVIYVSFGSNLKSSTMSTTKKQEFFSAFKKIPQKVMWKLENSSLPAGNVDVFTQSWFPQLDILCHPKVLAFVSHGGMLSLSEAAYCGKPLLTIPFFGDQFSNSAAVEESGLGIRMYFNEVNSKSLVDAIHLLTSQKMQQKVQHISKIFHDRPLNVMDSAIYWTEYVAKYGELPRLPALSTPWYSSLLLDVFKIGILIMCLSFVFIIYWIVKAALLLVLSKPTSMQKTKVKRAHKDKYKRSSFNKICKKYAQLFVIICNIIILRYFLSI